MTSDIIKKVIKTKLVKCPICARIKYVEEKVIIAICPACQEEMLGVKHE